MATYEHNALMQYIDEKGNMHINYPATKAENVMIGDSDVQTEITARAKTSDVLYTLEEISACTDFINKIAGAEAVNKVNSSLGDLQETNFTTSNNIKFSKIGKLVICHSEGWIPSGYKITIPSGFTPSSQYGTTFFPCAVQSTTKSDNDIAYIENNTIKCGRSDTQYIISTSWICD